MVEVMTSQSLKTVHKMIDKTYEDTCMLLAWLPTWEFQKADQTAHNQNKEQH